MDSVDFDGTAILRPMRRVAQLLVEPIEAPSPEAWVALACRMPSASLLESGRAQPADARWTILGVDPVESIVVSHGGARAVLDQLVANADQLPRVEPAHIGVPFRGGWIGYLSYDSGLNTERIRSRHHPDGPAPDAAFNFYDTALIVDHDRSAAFLLAVDWPEGVLPHRPGARLRIRKLAEALSAAKMEHVTGDTRFVAHGRLDDADKRESATFVERSFDEDAYRRAVSRARGYIESGDVYQINLSQRFLFQTHCPPAALYARLRTVNPASHAAMIRAGDTTILSASPELFLRLSGDRVITRPIKGTRPRQRVDALDHAARRELERDEKELAELTMIVDLLRNDLGRVCRAGSVRVVDPGSIEAHPNVFHRVATIEGRLADGVTWRDLVLASFPGGSVTGAPKVRAMQIIDELETVPRGVYCGAIGWIGLDGDMGMNVAIRTMVHVGDRVYVHAGGAITWDSDPDREYAEILAKARGMFQALDASDFDDRTPRAQDRDKGDCSTEFELPSEAGALAS